jgi:hypothetical protein
LTGSTTVQADYVIYWAGLIVITIGAVIASIVG